jgi:hypothetical protein
MAQWAGAFGDQGTVQEVSAPRHSDVRGASDDVEQDWDEEKLQSSKNVLTNCECGKPVQHYDKENTSR